MTMTTTKIAILGSDNSHAERFPEILNVSSHPDYWEDSNATVHAIWGEDDARTREVAEKVSIPKVASSPEEAVADAGIVFVVSRHGGLHLDLARVAIDARKPVFVDKPFTVSPDDARELVALAEEAAVPMVSFSTLRYGSDTAEFKHRMSEIGPVRYASYTGPASRHNDYGGLIFYSIHTVELMLHLHGIDVKSVYAIEHPAGAVKSNITATCSYDDGTLVTLAFIGDGAYHFHKRAIGAEGVIDSSEDERDLSADASSFGRAVGEAANRPSTSMSRGTAADHYPNGVREAVRVLRGEKTSDISPAQMIRAVQVCNAIEESLNTCRAINPSEL